MLSRHFTALISTFYRLPDRLESNYRLTAIEQVAISKDNFVLGLESCGGDQSTRLITTMSWDILVRVSQRLLNPIFI
jgi:hypothetical protein